MILAIYRWNDALPLTLEMNRAFREVIIQAQPSLYQLLLLVQADIVRLYVEK